MAIVDLKHLVVKLLVADTIFYNSVNLTIGIEPIPLSMRIPDISNKVGKMRAL